MSAQAEKRTRAKKTGGFRQMTIPLNASTETELRNAIFRISDQFAMTGSLSKNYIINIAHNITLTESLPMIRGDLGHSITIHGHHHTINANHTGRVFFVESGKVAIDDVSINNALAHGGNGGSVTATAGGTGGGGGLGAGAAVFVNKGAIVALTHVSVGHSSLRSPRGARPVSQPLIGLKF
jgi:hypothetical protein